MDDEMGLEFAKIHAALAGTATKGDMAAIRTDMVTKADMAGMRADVQADMCAELRDVRDAIGRLEAAAGGASAAPE